MIFHILNYLNQLSNEGGETDPSIYVWYFSLTLDVVWKQIRQFKMRQLENPC